MCDPVTIAGLALSAGGTYLESREQNKNQKRMMNAKNNAFEKGMREQQGYAEEAATAFRPAVNKQNKESFDESRQQGADQRMQAFTNIRSTDTANPLPASAPKNVILAQEAERARAGAETDQQANALFNLSGYGDALAGQDLTRNEYGRAFGNLDDKAGRYNRLTPLEMSAAENNAYKAPGMLPQVMKLAGSAASMYGAAGGGMPDYFSFGGKGSQVVNGVPVPGVKPNFVKNPFGSFPGTV